MSATEQANSCEQCGRPFTPTERKQRFCAESCRYKARQQRIYADPERRAQYQATHRNAAHRRRVRTRHSDLTTEQEVVLRTAAKTCELCGTALTAKSFKPDSKHLDHIVPLGIGGMHTQANVRIICALCNLKRPKDGSDLVGVQIALWAAEHEVFEQATSQLRLKPDPAAHAARQHAYAKRREDAQDRMLAAFIDRIVGRMSWDKVAARNGYRSGSNAQQIVSRKYGPVVRDRGPGRPAPRRKEAQRLRASGMTWREVAERMGISNPKQAQRTAAGR